MSDNQNNDPIEQARSKIETDLGNLGLHTSQDRFPVLSYMESNGINDVGLAVGLMKDGETPPDETPPEKITSDNLQSKIEEVLNR